jgi:P-type Mg2+ transporter
MVHMSGKGFFHHQNFRHAASKGHPEAQETDMVLSNEILAASRRDEKAIFALLRTSPEGLDPAEAQARLASAGPNLVTKEGRPSILRELWGRAKNPLNALLLSLAAVSYFLGDIRAAIVIGSWLFSQSPRRSSRSIAPMTRRQNCAPW